MAPIELLRLASLETVQERLGQTAIQDSLGFLRESCGQEHRFNCIIPPLVRGVLQAAQGGMHEDTLIEFVASFAEKGSCDKNVRNLVMVAIETLIRQRHLTRNEHHIHLEEAAV